MEFEIKNFNREADEEVRKLTEANPELYTDEQKRDVRNEIVRKKVAGAIASIADTLNGGSQEVTVEGLLWGLRCTHRYIQSEFWRGMLEFIKKTGDLDPIRDFDGRNEWTKDLCQRMAVAGWNPDAVDMEKHAS